MSVRYSKLSAYPPKAFVMAWGLKTFICTLKGCEFRYNEWHNLYTENDSNTFVQIDKYLQILSQGDIQ